MTTPARVPTVLLVLALLAALIATAPDARADKKDGRITFEVSTEPAAIGPGDSGTLVVKGTLLGPKHHIYSEGEQAIAYVPVKAQGVTYDLAAKTVTPSEDYTDEFTGEEQKVWHNTFTLKVPVTIAKDAAPDTKLGLSLTYYGCISGRGCYPPVKNHVASVTLGGGKAGANAPAAGNGGGAKPVNPRPDVAADTVQVPPAITEEEGGAEVRLDEKAGVITVSFTPSFGWHFYGPDDDTGSIQVSVEPVETEGVTFGKVDRPSAKKIEALDGYKVDVPFKREDSAKVIELRVGWQGCSEAGTCNNPRNETFRIMWPGAKAAETPTADGADEPVEPGEVLFPVVEDDDLGQGEDEKSFIRRKLDEAPILAFGIIFVLGLGLAFTPCVLPIIPITVSVISGGNADIPRKRLSALLAVYVLGLCLTFAIMGVVAAQTGGAMSALFAMKGVQWGIAILFLVLGFGMFGIYELQAPQWMTKLQGGAQTHSGSVVGAFLFGCLGAVIASPCTGPAIAALLIIAANEGSTLLGFSMFFVLGLGMGAVLFAAGSLNFMLRPGPWMTWVRFTFGIMIVAAAMYYLRNYDLISVTVMWILGLVVCVLAAVGIAWHLHKREGEEKGPARVRGIKVAVLTALAIGFVAWYTHVPDNLLSWTYAKDPEHLQQLVAEANENGKPVVVDFWGDWCTNCKVYDKRIATTPSLRKRFERITRIKVDLSDDADQVRWPMRNALGIEESGAPIMVFIDRKGRIRRAADLVGLEDEDVVIKHIDLVLKDKQPAKTSKR